MDGSVKPYACVLHSTLKTESSEFSSKREKKMSKRKTTGTGGSIRKRGNSWYYICYVTDPATGKRKQKWKGGFKTKKEAQEALAIIKAEVAKGTYTECSKTTFKEYAEEFLKIQEHTLRKSTIDTYRTVLKYGTDSISDKMLKDITVSDIIAIDEKLRAKGLLESTINNYHKHIKAIFNFAVRQEDLAKSPYKKFTISQAQKHKIELPSIDEFQKILVAAENYNKELYGILLVALTLGLRRGEIAGLQYGDFDFEANTVHVQRQIAAYMPPDERDKATVLKTASSDRVIGVPHVTMAYIQERMASNENTENTWYVFGKDGAVGGPHHINYLYKIFKHNNDVPNIRLHDFRHAYASICLEQGVSLKVISDMLGHADISTTANIYCETNRMRHLTANVMDDILD